jgi:hypothetical protein
MTSSNAAHIVTPFLVHRPLAPASAKTTHHTRPQTRLHSLPARYHPPRHPTLLGTSRCHRLVPQAVPLKDQEAFGPPRILLVGLSRSEAEAVTAWLAPSGLAISFCPAAVYTSATLEEVLLGASGSSAQRTVVHPWENINDAPAVCFFSGLSGPEAIALIEIWEACTGETINNCLNLKYITRFSAPVIVRHSES